MQLSLLIGGKQIITVLRPTAIFETQTHTQVLLNLPVCFWTDSFAVSNKVMAYFSFNFEDIVEVIYLSVLVIQADIVCSVKGIVSQSCCKVFKHN